jgi:hypothetical protein
MFGMKKRAHLGNNRIYGSPNEVTLAMHTEIHTGLHVKHSLFFMILTKTEIGHQFLINVSNLSFHENNAAVNALLKQKKKKQSNINKHTAGMKLCQKRHTGQIKNHQKSKHKHINN